MFEELKKYFESDWIIFGKYFIRPLSLLWFLIRGFEIFFVFGCLYFGYIGLCIVCG